MAGNPAAFLGEDIFRHSLEQAREHGAIALVAIKGKTTDPALQGIHPNHAYTVTDFDRHHVTLSDPTIAGSRLNDMVTIQR